MGHVHNTFRLYSTFLPPSCVASYSLLSLSFSTLHSVSPFFNGLHVLVYFSLVLY